MNILCIIILVICPLFAAENVVKFCGNGVFKCITSKVLRICLNGQLVSSEFTCPNSTYCSESSKTICTDIPDFDYSDYLESPDLKIKPETNPDLQCVEEGSFPITNSSCRKYYKCIKKGTGFFLKQLICKSGFFDPNAQTCLANYICPELPDDCNPIVIPKCETCGKQPIPNTGCTKYVLCKQTANGFETQIKECFAGGLFNPIRGLCDKRYICTEITKQPNMCTTTESTDPDITDITFLETTGSPNETITVPLITTTIDLPTSTVSIDTNHPDLSTTTTEGFDSNITNTTLTVTSTTGSPIANETITEPLATTIDLPTSTVSIDTNHPDLSTTTTEGFNSDITNTILTETTTTGPPIANETIPGSFITTTTDLPTTTVSIDTTAQDSLPECTQSGRFPVSNSGCKKYILCTVTTYGFLRQLFECPGNTRFDPNTQRCKTSYNCIEKSTPIATTLIQESSTEPYGTETSSPGNCLEQGKFAISDSKCKIFLNCIVTTTGFIEQVLQCPEGTNFNPELKKCTQTYICSEFSTIANTPAEVTVPSNEVCTEQGKFVLNNSNCKKYISCILTNNGFETTYFECPYGSLFDSSLQNCSSSFTCNVVPEEITTKQNECLEKPVVVPECTEEGRFAILGISCKKYILCAKTLTGYKGKEYECPNEAYFDPEKQRCLKNYQCIEKECPTTVEITTELIPTIPVLPNCMLQGRLEIPGTKCKKYILCTETRNGFVSSVYSCPSGSFFNPIKKRCSENYDCDEENGAVIKCTTIGRYPDSTDLDCKFYFDCTEEDKNNIHGIRKECKSGYYFDSQIQECSSEYVCQSNNTLLKQLPLQNVISPKFLVNGQCTTVGRYLVSFSNCKNYIYCSANTDGTLKATNFTCPTTTVFNQAIQKCTSPASYTCPDSFCLNNPGLIAWANPNIKDCTSYIVCQAVYDNFGMLLGYTGVIWYCPQGTRFNPILQACNSMYVCPQ